MGSYDGTFGSFLQGVSQQIPQERRDGQLGEQLNMLSDPASGLRRRSGSRLQAVLTASGGFSPDCFVELVNVLGEYYVMIINPANGLVHITDTNGVVKYSGINTYYVASSRESYKITVAYNQCFIVNTEKIPNRTNSGTNPAPNPKSCGYVQVLSGAFSKTYNLQVRVGEFQYNFSATTSASTAATASAQWVAEQWRAALVAESYINTRFQIERVDATIVLKAQSNYSNTLLTMDSSAGSTYVRASGASRVNRKEELPPALTQLLHGYTMAVGTQGNSSYFMYSHTTQTWKETGVWENGEPVFNNMPRYWYINTAGNVVWDTLTLAPRSAGDDDNNPYPKFVGYGITGIGAYQSRLVLLSGAYVCMSRTKDFNQFMRTTVEEVLDDDAIEVSSAALSTAQFEYAVAYNKDLVLIAQNQQAVIPSNNTVMTPKTAVIYPSTNTDMSLAVKPVVAGRSMYYAYQRGTDFYQIGELIPNSYTDAQYYSQGVTDHIPLYAQGVCKAMVASSTNNMAMFSSGTNEVLINQFLWSGDERPQMAFHKWVFPYPVVGLSFLQEYGIVFMYNAGVYYMVTLNTQLNSLGTKPVPYLDMYSYTNIVGGVGTIPANMPVGDLVAIIYDNPTLRHKEVQITDVNWTTRTFKCTYNGQVAIGFKFHSTFTLTPPFIKDEQGRVTAGPKTRITSIRMTFKDTGRVRYQVRDVMGEVVDNESEVMTWSEVDLGTSWTNSMSDLLIPHRTRLQSTECTISTYDTTDMNLVTTQYTVRIPERRKRI